MGQHKKPRNKTYVAKAVRVPSIIPLATAADAHPELAMRLHTGIQWFIDNPTLASANNFSQQLCLIAGAMSHAIGGAPVLAQRPGVLLRQSRSGAGRRACSRERKDAGMAAA